MPVRKVDPLGRNHQTVKRPTNRSNVDSVCNFILKHEQKSFMKKPSIAHVYFDAYSVIFGNPAAVEMLKGARK